MAKTKKKTNINPKSLENLKPCKPGETHNPKGRGKGVRNWDVVMREMFEAGEITQDDIVFEQAKRAKAGDLKAAEWMAERMDGKAKERLGISIDDSEITKKLKEIFIGNSTKDIQ